MRRLSTWALGMLVATACASEPLPTSELSTTTAPSTTTATTITTLSASGSTGSTTLTEVDVALEFLKGVYEADYDLAVMDAAIEMTQPGSPARYFAELHRATAAATLAFASYDPRCTGGGVNPDVVCPQVERTDAESVEVCSYNWAMVGLDRCVAFRDLRVADGEVVTFTVRGIEIESRLGTAGSPATVGPVTARVTSSYLAVPDEQLRVAFDLARTDLPPDTDVGVTVAAYLAPDGSRSSPSRSLLTSPLVDTSVVAVTIFERADPGGTLLVDVTITEPLDECSGDGSCTQETFLGQLTLDVPAHPPGRSGPA